LRWAPLSALAGPKAAMAVTAAVETEIDRHYQAQREALAGDDPELEGLVAEFQADELEHRDIALAHGAEEAPAYPLMSAMIRAGCRAAIRVSEKI
jgi:3-demethoxyubiquinol 3-hydroxylase